MPSFKFIETKRDTVSFEFKLGIALWRIVLDRQRRTFLCSSLLIIRFGGF